MCFQYFLFAQEKVDVAVMEVDMGGLFDSTNVISSPNKICVISDIGYDHTHILGNKIGQIATQKAGIIGQGNSVVFIDQSYKTSTKIILEQAKKQLATNLVEVTSKNYNSKPKGGLEYSFFQQNESADKKITLNLKFKNQKIELKTNLLGDFQAKNLALAATASLIFFQKNANLIRIKKEDSRITFTITIRFAYYYY